MSNEDKEIKQEINRVERQIEVISQNYKGFFHSSEYEKTSWNLPESAISSEDVALLLSSKVLNKPCGLNILKLASNIDLPILSVNLSTLNNPDLHQKAVLIQKKLSCLQNKLQKETEEIIQLRENYFLSFKPAIEMIAKLTITQYGLPKPLRFTVDTFYQEESRALLVTLHAADIQSINIMKQKKQGYRERWVETSAREQKKLKEDILYSLCIRSGYLAAKSDTNDNIDLVVVNFKQSWFDKATGAKKEGVIASLQASKNNFANLDIDKIDPKVCFKYFKGISTPSVDEIVAIRPIFDLDKNDSRIIDGKNVSDFLDSNANLAEMPWDDFEHLVRQLFEWEFGNKGVEVKITCASRDRGVDAIMYDSDPLKGGKYVLQAKRYNRTVDVSAVRDLYGTVMNEGANRGILVTTSSYGPDTYEFAKDKPISLVDGQNLIQMLKKHGKNFHIKLNKESN